MTYYIFTDGGAEPNADNTYRAAWGMYVVKVEADIGGYSHELIYKNSGKIENGTNNRAELSAIISALNYAKSHKINPTIISDSEYAIKCITAWGPEWRKNPKKEKGKLNLDLVYAGIDLLEQLGEVKFEHINSHINIKRKNHPKKAKPTDEKSLEWIKWYYNEKVDELCTLTIR